MKKILKQLVVAVLGMFISQAALASEDLKLVFAFDLIRHADRAPVLAISELSNVWTRNEVGKLTPRGFKDAQIFGGQLRKYYVDESGLLPPELNADCIQVRSTDYERTQSTATSLLKGLYPQAYSKVPILVVPRAEDVILRGKEHQNSGFTAIIKSADEKFRVSTAVVYEQAREAVKELNKIFGTHFNSPLHLIHAADLINVATVHNKPLIKPLDAQQAKRIVQAGQSLCLAFVTDYPQVACARAQALILNIADLLQGQLTGSSPCKYVLYSGHDSNITSAAFLLGAPQYAQPPYLSDLRFEMFKSSKTGANFVKVSLNGEVIKVCGEVMCQAEEFVVNLRARVENQCRYENTGH